MSLNKRTMGGTYEETAARFLVEKGLSIIEKNYRCPAGEIDLIARDGRYYVFIEVKYRTDGSAGDPMEAVDRRKQQRISRVARNYLARRVKNLDVPCRFDVVGFRGPGRICWIRNAFDYIG